MTKIQFELDGKQVEAIDGETIWQVAKRQGREIPHLCYSVEPGYRPDGNCRACMVEVEGERVLAGSWIRKSAAGMKVQTASQRAHPAPPHPPLARSKFLERARPYRVRPQPFPQACGAGGRPQPSGDGRQ